MLTAKACAFALSGQGLPCPLTEFVLQKFYRMDTSRKHTYISLTPLNPHFYTVKLGFTGVYIIFLISAQNIDCGTRKNRFEQKYEKYQNFLSENFHFLVVEFSVYLNRHVFVMDKCPHDILRRHIE